MKSRENRRQYWQKHLKAFNKSDLSQREYCRQADIGYWSFNQWKRRLEKDPGKSAITEVRCKPVMFDSTSKNEIVIKYNSSIQISLPASISPEILAAILNSLGEYTCR